MKSKSKEVGGMVSSFDSYIQDGKFYIVTIDKDEFGEYERTLHNISINRAKEILKDLQENINLLSK